MSSRISIVIIVLLSFASCYFFYSYTRLKSENIDVMLTSGLPERDDSLDEELTGSAANEEYVTFYICGEVIAPDIYSLPKGSRIMDAIMEAGGHTEEAALDMMESVAKEIVDGQKIYVPNIDDDIDKINYMNNNVSSGQYTGTVKNPDAIVNINTATAEELCQIPGIGEATAKLILDYRQENGGFTLIEDIKNVPRIGDKTFENIKKNITVE